MQPDLGNLDSPRRRWFERRFELGFHADAFFDILERLRGTPARLEERLAGLPADILVRRPGNAWSIQENAGHLLDLESLWELRLDELLSGATELSPADLQNRKTHEASHNARELSSLLADFRRVRLAILERPESLEPAQLAATALHPRLKQPMSVIDLFFFVAEHDDHHLARITEILTQTR
jgi:uncharacterized damage-inducible protein DinB